MEEQARQSEEDERLQSLQEEDEEEEGGIVVFVVVDILANMVTSVIKFFATPYNLFVIRLLLHIILIWGVQQAARGSQPGPLSLCVALVNTCVASLNCLIYG